MKLFQIKGITYLLLGINNKNLFMDVYNIFGILLEKVSTHVLTFLFCGPSERSNIKSWLVFALCSMEMYFSTGWGFLLFRRREINNE